MEHGEVRDHEGFVVAARHHDPVVDPDATRHEHRPRGDLPDPRGRRTSWSRRRRSTTVASGAPASSSTPPRFIAGSYGRTQRPQGREQPSGMRQRHDERERSCSPGGEWPRAGYPGPQRATETRGASWSTGRSPRPVPKRNWRACSTKSAIGTAAAGVGPEPGNAHPGPRRSDWRRRHRPRGADGRHKVQTASQGRPDATHQARSRIPGGDAGPAGVTEAGP